MVNTLSNGCAQHLGTLTKTQRLLKAKTVELSLHLPKWKGAQVPYKTIYSYIFRTGNAGYYPRVYTI